MFYIKDNSFWHLFKIPDKKTPYDDGGLNSKY